jgi:hypothetical protein
VLISVELEVEVAGVHLKMMSFSHWLLLLVFLVYHLYLHLYDVIILILLSGKTPKASRVFSATVAFLSAFDSRSGELYYQGEGEACVPRLSSLSSGNKDKNKKNSGQLFMKNHYFIRGFHTTSSHTRQPPQDQSINQSHLATQEIFTGERDSCLHLGDNNELKVSRAETKWSSAVVVSH